MGVYGFKEDRKIRKDGRYYFQSPIMTKGAQ
jgi:hypothetical protein